jgi:hypothetical protein
LCACGSFALRAGSVFCMLAAPRVPTDRFKRGVPAQGESPSAPRSWERRAARSRCVVRMVVRRSLQRALILGNYNSRFRSATRGNHGRLRLMTQLLMKQLLRPRAPHLHHSDTKLENARICHHFNTFARVLCSAEKPMTTVHTDSYVPRPGAISGASHTTAPEKWHHLRAGARFLTFLALY